MKRTFPTPVKRSKYGNKKVEFDGFNFDSIREKQRYIVLKDAVKKGLISDLQLHVKYELIPSITEEYVEHLKTKDKVKTRTLQLPITYTCDFQYIKDGELVVEDVKISEKMIPKEFIIKEKLMFWKYRIKIKRVFKPNENI